MANPVAVIAFGGNAILKRDERGTQEEQIRHCDEACDLMAQIVQRGYDLVIVHGNGPQVGNILIQMEEAVTRSRRFRSMCVCGHLRGLHGLHARTLASKPVSQARDQERKWLASLLR